MNEKPCLGLKKAGMHFFASPFVVQKAFDRLKGKVIDRLRSCLNIGNSILGIAKFETFRDL